MCGSQDTCRSGAYHLHSTKICLANTCFDRLRPYLHDAGYETVAVSHTSANPKDPYAHTAETMALNIQENYLQPLLDAGKKVLVYAYSSGGSQTGTNGPSWTLSDREARGEKGGVVSVEAPAVALGGGLGVLLARRLAGVDGEHRLRECRVVALEELLNGVAVPNLGLHGLGLVCC